MRYAKIYCNKHKPIAVKSLSAFNGLQIHGLTVCNTAYVTYVYEHKIQSYHHVKIYYDAEEPYIKLFGHRHKISDFIKVY